MFCTFATHRSPILFLVAVTLLAPACGERFGESFDERRLVNQAYFNAAGDLVVSADDLVSVFDSELDKKRFSFEHGFTKYERNQKFDVANQGTVAATATTDSVIVFDTQTGKRTLTLGPAQLDVDPKLTTLELLSLAVSPNGQYVAVESYVGREEDPRLSYVGGVSSISVFRVGTGERLWQRLAPLATPMGSTVPQSKSFHSLLFSADSQRIWAPVYGWENVTAEVSQLIASETGTTVGSLIPQGALPTSLGSSRDHSAVLGWMSEGPMKPLLPAAWSATDGTLIQAFPPLAGAECGPSSTEQAMTASADGQLFAGVFWGACPKDAAGNGHVSGNVVLIWTREGQVLHQLPIKQVTTLDFSPDGTKLAVAEYWDGVSVYRMTDGVRTAHRIFEKKLF